MHQTWGIELGLHLGISNFRCCNSLKQTFFPLNIALSSLPHNCINRTLHYIKCNLSITPLLTVSLEYDALQKSTVAAKNDMVRQELKKDK